MFFYFSLPEKVYLIAESFLLQVNFGFLNCFCVEINRFIKVFMMFLIKKKVKK